MDAHNGVAQQISPCAAHIDKAYKSAEDRQCHARQQNNGRRGLQPLQQGKQQKSKSGKLQDVEEHQFFEERTVVLLAIAALPKQQLGQTAHHIEQVTRHDELQAALRHDDCIRATAVGHANAHRKHEGRGSQHSAIDIVQAVLESRVHILLAINIDERVDHYHRKDGYKLSKIEGPLPAGVYFFGVEQFHRLQYIER